MGLHVDPHGPSCGPSWTLSPASSYPYVCMCMYQLTCITARTNLLGLDLYEIAELAIKK